MRDGVLGRPVSSARRAAAGCGVRLVSVERTPHLPRAGAAPALRPGRLGEATLDIAVTHSMNNGMAGRIGLHADDAGGDGLLAWYRDRGLTRLPPDARLPRSFSRNDGRYFYFSMAAAAAFSRSLDDFRTNASSIGQN